MNEQQNKPKDTEVQRQSSKLHTNIQLTAPT